MDKNVGKLTYLKADLEIVSIKKTDVIVTSGEIEDNYSDETWH